jgi:hypothetical protein
LTYFPCFVQAFSLLKLVSIDFFPLYFSVFLGKIKDAFDRNPELQNLLLDDFFKSAVENCQVCNQQPGGTRILPVGFARWHL